MCTLVLVKNFALFLAKKFAPQFHPSWTALSFPLPKTLHFSKQFAFVALSNGVTDRGSKQQSKRSSFRLHRSSFSSKNWKNESNGIPTTVRKTEVRTTPVRSQECEYQQCEETTVRMRQKCEGQVCEGQECECDFSAIGQNSEVIQIERSRSFCLQDGVFFSLFLSQSLSFSLGLCYTLGLG